MKDKPTQEQISKLPLWAQDLIKYQAQERDIAIRALNEHLDLQTPSKVYFEKYLSTGEQQGPSLKKFYVQYDRLTFEHAGILLQVNCWNADPMHDNSIELQWSVPNGTCDMVAFVPRSFQSAALISHENMRVMKLRKAA